jgi:hypothetical protein
MRLLRKCLDQGMRVELDGLGSFVRDDAGEFQFHPATCSKVFIAYVEENAEAATRLFQALREKACDPWMDRQRLLPGQNWPRAIERAIDVADYFVALFSRKSVAKKGTFQSELRYALDCARRQPLDRTFVVPVRLEPCDIPNGISSAIQYVDLFPDWDSGVERLVQTVSRRPPSGGW